MKMLSKLEYLQLMRDAAEEFSPASDTIERVLAYAASVWAELELKERPLGTKDLAAVYRHGHDTFFHIKAFPRKAPDTFVIVIAGEPREKVVGHILIDLAAEYAEPFLDCPSFDFAGQPTESDLQSMIPQLDPDADNPFAILSLGDGTYMQTLRMPEGFLLEHQLVNTSSHYEVPSLSSSEEVVEAMVSYAFGNHEWLERFPWQRQIL